jgi:hypothetical protein
LETPRLTKTTFLCNDDVAILHGILSGQSQTKKGWNYNISDDWDFPNNAVGLGIRLKKLRSTLLRIGIKIEKKKDRANSKWIIEILKENNQDRKNLYSIP